MSEHDDIDTSATRADSDGQAESQAHRSESGTTQIDGAPDASGEDSEASAATPEGQLEAARREAADNFERFMRARADIENIRKRHQRELEDRARYDGELLARDVLQAVDDLERALEHAGTDAAGVSGGIELVLKGLLAALKRNGVERIDAQGKPFDPAEHEAVTMVESAELAPNSVVGVFRAGYKMRDRLLRPAMVSVSKSPEAKAE